MKFNFNTLKNTFDNIKPTKKIIRVYNHIFEILGYETYTGWRMFEEPYQQKLDIDERIPSMIMELNIRGVSVRELALYKYLINYKEYVIYGGMQRTAPFHLNIKKEIKNLIDKIESSII